MKKHAMPEKKPVELKSCPFCGTSDLLQTDKMVNEQLDEAQETLALAGADPTEPEEWFVVCGVCSAMGPLSPSPAEAHTVWNKRFEGGSGP